MSIRSWFRSATWPLRQFIVRCAVWFEQGVKEAIVGLLGVAFVTILVYSVVEDVSIIAAITTWTTLFTDVFGLISVGIEIVVFGGLARTAVYIEKQERIGKIGLTIFLIALFALAIMTINIVPGGITLPSII